MKKFYTILLCFISIWTFSQTKRELKAKIVELEKQVSINKQDKDNLKTRLDRISSTEIDKVITADKLPKDIVIGESGWRVELNGSKYKSDLIGQLGTIWIVDEKGLLQPQGTILLSDYKIDPILTNPNKDILYKSFVSKGTKFEGDGGILFVKLQASMKEDQYSRFTINIEGTSLIKPQFIDLEKIALLAKNLFDIKGNKGVYICTGMHVIKYRSEIYSRNEGDGKITTPVINIGGQFYTESSEENSEYFVARQLTQLNKQIPKTSTSIAAALNIANSTSIIALEAEAKKYSPEQLLSVIINSTPTFDQIVEFQDNPQKFILTLKSSKEQISDKDVKLSEIAKMKLNSLPDKILSDPESTKITDF